MLRLRKGTVVEAEPLTVDVGGERRLAWADPEMVGPVEAGDEVVVNVAALDLGLGSGGFDVVHVNLTRGLDAEASGADHVMKLNYTSLQHPIEPIEEHRDGGDRRDPPMAVLVIPLHGHLAPAAWAAEQALPGTKVGFIQGPGGALPGSLSRDVARLRDRGLLAGHVTAGPCHGGDLEAVTVAGAIDAAAVDLGWTLAIVGPGPGIQGSESRYGHGGMAAFDAASASLGLGWPTLLSPRLSSSDPRPRHRGLSHHTRTVLEMLRSPVRVPVPEASLEGWPVLEDELEGGSPQAALDDLIEVCGGRHDIAVQQIDLAGYGDSGLPTLAMGRSLGQDPLFFAAPLAAGRALAGASGPE
jgi:hypothetical protein